MKHVVVKIFLSLLMVCSYSFSFAQTDLPKEKTKQEVLIVEVYYGMSLTGIYIHRSGKETEFIEMDRILTKGKIGTQGMLMVQTFQKLYDEGWEIVTSEATSSPSLNIFRYMMARSIH